MCRLRLWRFQLQRVEKPFEFYRLYTELYRNLFRNDMNLSALGLSLVIALVASIVATVLGTMASIGIHSMNRGARNVIMNISYMPVINPEIITGVSMMLLFVVVKNWMGGKVFGMPTLLIAHITFCVPYVIFNVSPKLRQMDVRMWEAALDLGCTPVQAFFKVVLPEIMPAVLSSFLICLTYSIDDFIISYFTSGTLQTLPIAIYSMTRKKVSPGNQCFVDHHVCGDLLDHSAGECK